GRSSSRFRGATRFALERRSPPLPRGPAAPCAEARRSTPDSPFPVRPPPRPPRRPCGCPGVRPSPPSDPARADATPNRAPPLVPPRPPRGRPARGAVHEQEIDVRLRCELAAAVAPERDERRSAGRRSDLVQLDQAGVDELRPASRRPPSVMTA